MKNLNQMGVQEMNTQEMKKVDGGFWITLGRIVIVGGLIRIAEEVWEGFKEGFNENIDPEITVNT